MKTSFGILFLDAIVGAAGRATSTALEDLTADAFHVREAGIGENMDLMTYSMYHLVQRDSGALLNYTTPVTHANHTLQTFFQHFVNNSLSMMESNWGYEKIGDGGHYDLGRALSVGIVAWLIATAAVVACVQRRYTSSMLRNVELLADVLVLIAGSENLLSLVQKRGLDLKRDTEVKTMLGWFKGRDGVVRRGMEVVGGRDAVEWVSAPQKDFVYTK
ncbi:uncharacterized protein N0V89_001041 [Didymosphaeria variabile]|uniref:Uncharacterized protein n=1 Tax=Didymosphaeria variabile TaxID=1932322 RepID=A0A9W8XXX4_9PLEO|nr:uncharacterized protein N0V89_001041 [Didymosphaeria variabile]KAJ4360477.1 hypothetical protein N0V89_001041 [Didymosphaeria variabile]